MAWDDGRSFPLGPDICFVVPRGISPVATQNPRHRLTVFACHFEPETPTEAGQPDWQPPPAIVLRREAAFFWKLAERCEQCAARGDVLGQTQSRQCIEQMVLHLWEQVLIPSPTPEEERIQEVMRAIRDFPGRDWSVDRQAERVDLSRAQYTRLFTRVSSGIPPAAFVAQTRLERAAQLIRETDMTLTHIAEALGYRDLFYFSRQFKKHYGIPPKRLRDLPEVS